MLYCVQDLVEKLLREFSGEYDVETNKIPESEARLIAVFSRQ